MIVYNGCRMDKPLSIARMSAMLALANERGEVSAADMREHAGVKPRMATLYVTYLCSIGRLAVKQAAVAVPGRNRRATYCPGPVTAPLPLVPEDGTVCTIDAIEGIQRRVGANDWLRGQHAHRSGLLAAMFPFTRESTAAEA